MPDWLPCKFKIRLCFVSKILSPKAVPIYKACSLSKQIDEIYSEVSLLLYEVNFLVVGLSDCNPFPKVAIQIFLLLSSSSDPTLLLANELGCTAGGAMACGFLISYFFLAAYESCFLIFCICQAQNFVLTGLWYLTYCVLHS